VLNMRGDYEATQMLRVVQDAVKVTSDQIIAEVRVKMDKFTAGYSDVERLIRLVSEYGELLIKKDERILALQQRVDELEEVAAMYRGLQK